MLSKFIKFKTITRIVMQNKIITTNEYVDKIILCLWDMIQSDFTKIFVEIFNYFSNSLYFINIFQNKSSGRGKNFTLQSYD